MEAVIEPKTESDEQEEHFTGESEKFLTFVLDDEEYGIEILKVREIIGMMAVTPVPQSSPRLKGIINLRGQIIPVFDLRLIFGMVERDHDSETCIIIVDVSGNLVGVIVDTVSEVMSVKGDEVEAGSDLEKKVKAQFILGIPKVEGKIRILIEIEKEVIKVNKLMKNVLNSIKLRFIANERSRTGLIQVINNETGELVKQIHPDKLLNFMARPNEGVIGIILDPNLAQKIPEKGD
ncbi:MAG: flagellar protein FlaG [Candidatus Anammoxibacter sp.]